MAPRSASPARFKLDAALGDAGLARIGEFHASWHGKGDGRVQAWRGRVGPTCARRVCSAACAKLQEELGADRDRAPEPDLG
jgi:hypothetical protein